MISGRVVSIEIKKNDKNNNTITIKKDMRPNV
jgi:hypothetical protein